MLVVRVSEVVVLLLLVLEVLLLPVLDVVRV